MHLFQGIFLKITTGTDPDNKTINYFSLSRSYFGELFIAHNIYTAIGSKENG